MIRDPIASAQLGRSTYGLYATSTQKVRELEGRLDAILSNEAGARL